ncbi:putative Ig domain-containing protein [Kitasatospora mediocidica]|uniref:putative Ig domain-containing protein n=1 Tax=Kitasatospora mediocidica TaxID=58352 RepID=UPI0009FBF989|nr:putative Ig domain-containing protein [Kitasatospora mediocidica]
MHHSARRGRPALLARFSVLGLLVAMVPTAFAAGTANAAASASTPAGPAGITVARSCAEPTHPGEMACLALKRTDVHESALAAPAVPSGYGPGDLTSAYNLPSGGSGQTVAIVDAQDDPNAESDLASYRSNYGLPACTTANGCFRKIDENGGTNYPSPDTGWAGEISLDVDMVSAVCPNCHILLVEATSASDADLGTAVNQAVAQGAKFISNSYGGSEDSSVTSSDAAYFNHPGVAITVSAGDSNYGAEYPATSQYVTAVGGTALTRASNARGWSESVWNTNSTEGTGSGCSAYLAKPSWQHDTGCSHRMETDVSAVADPATGVAVYQTYGGSGWAVYGGTSAASPIIASVWALAGAPAAGDRAAQYPYNHTSSFNDVTTGNNGSCSVAYYCKAGAGYDGPTGWGTPNGTSGFSSGSPAPGETVTVANPGNQSGTVGTSASVQVSATDSAGNALTYSATGLPAGLTISSTGLISGTPTTATTANVTVTASSGTASGSTTFSWTVKGGSTGETVTFRSPGNQSGVTGTAVSLQVAASDSAGNALTYSATGLPAGLTISSTGLISGTPTTATTANVTVTASSGTASGSTTFTWTVTSGGGGGCGGLTAWSAATSYVPGAQVSYNGHKWLSTWYSTGSAPGAPASWAVWSDQGAC